LVFTALDADSAAVSGIPTTVKVTNGFLIDSLNRVGTERIVYANDTIWILGLKTGVTTVTATNGTLTSTAKINFANAKTDARVLSLSESAGTVTASVTDFYGNPVAGASLTAVTTGGGRLGNGASSNTFSTNAEGKVEIGVTVKQQLQSHSILRTTLMRKRLISKTQVTQQELS